jgi:hypothetical protein
MMLVNAEIVGLPQVRLTKLVITLNAKKLAFPLYRYVTPYYLQEIIIY